MKQCLRKKCQKDFEPNKPKQVFCSAKCRVYFTREEKRVDLKDLSQPANYAEPLKPKVSKKSNTTVDTMPDPNNKIAYLQWLRKKS